MTRSGSPARRETLSLTLKLLLALLLLALALLLLPAASSAQTATYPDGNQLGKPRGWDGIVFT